MTNQRRYATLLILVLLIIVVGVWGIVLVRQTTANSPAPMPTLAEIADIDATLTNETDADSTSSSNLNNNLETVLYDVNVLQEPALNQYVLEFYDEYDAADMSTYIETLNIEVVESLTELNRVVVIAEPSTIEQLSSDVIVSTEPNYYASALLTLPPTDTYYEHQWNLEMIGAPLAWAELPAVITPIRIAVIDSGVCFDHPDMQGTYTAFQRDYVDNDSLPQDIFGHGCSVTGVIASQNNDIGVMGIAPFVEIMPLRVLDENGIGAYSNIAQAIVDATNQGVQIINLSLGGYNDSSMLKSAIDYALVNNVFVVAATGNNGQSTPLYPATYDGVIAVGSVNSDGVISSFSNRGEDTLAPGEAILAPYFDDSYVYLSGTSLAAPHVAGVIALDLALGREPIINNGIIRVKSVNPTSPTIIEVLPDVPVPEETIAPQLTDRWLVRLAEDADADSIAQTLGYTNLGQVGDLPSYYVFSVADSDTSTAQSQLAISALSNSPNILEFTQELLKIRDKRQLPTDPLTSDQWHLVNIGQTSGTEGEDIDVIGAWNDGITGAGVTIAIVDDGLQYTHPDLAPQYNASGSFDYNSSDPNSVLDSDNDPAPDSIDTHGTSVGGVAAADDDGTTCGVGVAYDANLSGLRLIAHAIVESQEVAALNRAIQINDIYNNSWGPSDSGAYYEDLGSATIAALANGVTNGRDGKGVIYVFASGNGLIYDDSSNYDGYASSRYTIAVGATDHTGDLASAYLSDGNGGYIEDGNGNPISFYYSEGGANVFVNAPSGHQPGIVTTDLLGSDGYNNTSGYSNDCTDDFGGTSSAAPTVSGVIALILEANPNLTWRDVQYILAETADKNDPTALSWQTNAAGYETSYYYGFGRVNASAAVALAKTWINVTSEITAGPYTPFSSPSIAIPDGLSAWSNDFSTYPSYGAPVSKNIGTPAEQIQFVETVEVEIDVTHSRLGDLAFVLESAEGTYSTLSLSRRYDATSGNITLEMSTNEFWGETALGNWYLYVYDGYTGETGTLNDWSMTVYGTRGTYLVNTTSDTTTCDGASCSLRSAIQHANAYTADTGNQGVVIVPAGTYTLSRIGTESWSTHDLDITENIRIIGAGRDQTIIDANGIDRVFDVYARARIEHLSITGGVAPNGEDGGGIRINEDSVVPVGEYVELNGLRILDNSTVNGSGGGLAIVGTNTYGSYSTLLSYSIIEGNVAFNGGGIAVQKDAELVISETEINGNNASNLGGGIYGNTTNGITYISLSTVANNTAQSGGGYYLDSGTSSSIFNSTISGNSVTEDGGGLYFNDTSGTIALGNTIANNTADSDSSNTGYGGGIFIGTSQQSVVDFGDSIITSNIDNSGTAPDCYSGTYTLNSYSRNIIGDATNCLVTTFENDDTFNQYDFFNIDPLLNPLADNGGYTRTHALPSNSHAIDKTAMQSCRDVLGHDQRGILRNIDMKCDIGAYEYDASIVLPIVPQVISVNHLKYGPITQHEGFYILYGDGIYNNYVSVLDEPNTLSLHFNKSVKDSIGDTHATDVTNSSNYLLITDGANGSLDTTTCGIAQGDDITIVLDSLWHTQAYNTIFLNINGGTALPSDTYRLMTCNLVDHEGNAMKEDFVYDFIVGDTLTAYVALSDPFTSTVSYTEYIHEYDVPQNSIKAVFNRDAINAAGDTGSNDVTNPNNYHIVTDGTDGVFQTDSCTIQGDDQQIAITNVTYSSSEYEKYSTINLATSLIDDRYRFIVCDEIEDTANQSFDGDRNGIVGGDFVTEFIVFPKPINVQAITGNGGVHLTWSDINISETGFAVSRKTGSSYWQEIGTVGANITSFDDSTVTCGIDYTYRLQSRGNLVWSGYTDELVVTVDCNNKNFIVNSTSDSNDGTCDIASCSLREAIIAANIYGDGAVVSVPAGTYLLSISGTGEDLSATGDLDITANIHVIGAGRDQTIIDANQVDRVFDVFAVSSISSTQIEAVTITGGQPENGANGGGIRFMTDTVSTLAIVDAQITNNESTGNGGGIASQNNSYIAGQTIILGIHGVDVSNNTAVNGGAVFNNNGHTSISDSNIAYNSASSDGGGLFITEHARAQVIFSVVHHNDANQGGGAYFLGFPNDQPAEDDVFAQFMNSTVSNNSALSNGGGIVSKNQVRSFLRFSTITENIADSDNNNDGDGGGIYFDDVTMLDINSAMNLILDGNVDLSGQANDCVSDPLVTISIRTTSMFPEMLDCVIGGVQSYIGVDPMLGSLADNGGGTLTHSIPSTNPAIDSGFSLPLWSFHYYMDQRGQKNNAWGEIDAGAFEYSSESFNELPELVNISIQNTDDYQPYEVPLPIYGYDYFGVGTNRRTISVYFDELLSNPLNNTVLYDVTNSDNYLIVEEGADNTLSTTTCDSVTGDDVAISLSGDDAVSYHHYNKRASIKLASPLSAGEYRLIACNLRDLGGQLLDGNHDGIGGDPVIYDFGFDDTTARLGVKSPTAYSNFNRLPTQQITTVHEAITSLELEIYSSGDPVYDPGGDSDPNDVTNLDNYLLVSAGANESIETNTCGTALGDDSSYTLSVVPIDSDSFTLNINTALPDGLYRLIICNLKTTLGIMIDGDADYRQGGNYIGDFIIFPKPTNITGTLNSGSIDLTWDDNSATESKYVVERRISDTGWFVLGETASDVDVFNDTDTICDTEYIYRIYGYRASDTTHSGYSNEITINFICPPMVDPDNLVATAVSGTHIDLTWNDNNGLETAYKIERRVSGGSFAVIADAPQNATSYSDASVVCDVSYDYRIRVYRSYDDKYSGYSNIESVTDLDCPPSSPSSLAVNPVVGLEQLNLLWIDNSSNETEFRIERWISGTWSQIDTVTTDETSYSDTDVACYTAYDYRVIAFRSGDSAVSLPSTVATGTTSCTTVNAPTNLTGTLNETTIDLSWTDNAPDEDNFQIQRSISGTWTTLGTSPANTTVYNDTTTVCGDTYDYRVRAQRSGTDSPYSEVFTIQQVCAPPIAPSNLTVVAVPFSNDIQLDWTDNSNSETDFLVQRSLNGNDSWGQVGAVVENMTTFTDVAAGLSCYIPYHYQVLAYRNDDSVLSDPSASTSISTWCDPDLLADVNNPITDNKPTGDISGVVGFPQPSCAPNMNHAYVWEFPAVADSNFNLTTFGSSIDTMLSIWSFDGTTFTELSCNDDSALDGTSALVSSFPVGSRYIVIVGGKNNTSGNITLNSEIIAPPTATPIPTNTLVPTATETPNLTTVGIFKDGAWLFRDSNSSGTADIAIRFGTNIGDDWSPLVGDWNGDGVDGIGLYKDGRWFLRDVVETGSSADYVFRYGANESGWQPVVGDWDGDGADGIGLYKDGIWLLKNSPASGDADYSFRFNPTGSTEAIAIAGDWHDESVDRVGLYQDGTWFLSYSHRTRTDAKIFQYGPTDGSWQPIVGDWDKDGDDTIGIYKDSGWRLRNTNSRGNPDLGMTFGLDDAIPIAGYRGNVEVLALFARISDFGEPASIPTVTSTIEPDAVITTDEQEITPTTDATENPANTLTPTWTGTPTLEATDSNIEPSTLTPSLSPTWTGTPTIVPTATETLIPSLTPTQEPPTIPDNVSGT